MRKNKKAFLGGTFSGVGPRNAKIAASRTDGGPPSAAEPKKVFQGGVKLTVRLMQSGGWFCRDELRRG